MKNLEDIKRNWKEGGNHMNPGQLDKATWHSLLELRAKKQRNIGMQYFWASLTFQIIVYGFLVHVTVRYWQDTSVLLPNVLCILIYVPFTVVLMRKFKRMAMLWRNEEHISDMSIKEHIIEQHSLFTSFYRFKTKYEIVLVPLSSAIFVYVFFKLYLSGGVSAHPISSFLLFIVIVGACGMAILAENKRNFKMPIDQLEEILKDINSSKK